MTRLARWLSGCGILAPAMRQFGLEEANRLVPFLTRTFEAARPVVNRLALILESLERRGSRTDLLEEREALSRQLEQLFGPVQELGIELKAADGLVDFPAMREGRVVYLCWRYPEKEVSHWHEVEAGFDGRQRIESPEEFAATFLC